MIRRHQRRAMHGYCIPNSMEWMFWPIGWKPLVLQGRVGDVVTMTASSGRPEYRPLIERFKVVR